MQLLCVVKPAAMFQFALVTVLVEPARAVQEEGHPDRARRDLRPRVNESRGQSQAMVSPTVWISQPACQRTRFWARRKMTEKTIAMTVTTRPNTIPGHKASRPKKNC